MSSASAADSYRLVFERHPEAMWIHDAATSEVLAVNDAALRQYGYSREEFLGITMRELGAREDLALDPGQMIEVPSETSDLSRHRRRDGTLIDVLLRAEEIAFEGHPARLVVASDVTSEVQAETIDRELAEARVRSVAETVARLSRAVEMRDKETGGHSDRIGLLTAHLARRLNLPDEKVEVLRQAAPMHDVGKIGLADRILLKPGPLTPDERGEMERHTTIGYELLAGSDAELLQSAAIIALTHHEWYDGSGYPQHLGGEAIPLEGRVVAVADVFDALTSDRVYRPAFSVDEAIAMMAKLRERQFDPPILDELLDDPEAAVAVAHPT